MKSLILSALSLAVLPLACSPIPELNGVFQAGEGGNITDGGVPEDHSFHKPTDDMGTSGGQPCPAVFPPTTMSFCYWPQGTGDSSISTALRLIGTDPNCTLMAGRLSVKAATSTCSAEFDPAIVAKWNFSTMKVSNMIFSYSIKSGTDHAILTVTMPSGSGNQAITVNGISGNSNVINLFTPMGTTFTPEFGMALGGSAKTATLSLDWISVWQ